MNTSTQTDRSTELIADIELALARSIEFAADCPPRLQQAIDYSLLAPGKRLRPQLVLLAAEACGGEMALAMPAAVAVEMVHTYSLIHDDLPAMDDDDLRRGRPTCHKKFDEATAILVGDALLARAFEVLAAGIEPAEQAIRCCEALARAAGPTALVGGQADDLSQQNQKVPVRIAEVEQLESIHRRKTGALFCVSLQLGAIVADASEEQESALATYGHRLGLAFQVVDDLLDVAGSEEAVGKRVGKDSKAGKTTYPTLLGVEGSRERVEALITEACAALECFGDTGDALREIADFVRRRNR